MAKRKIKPTFKVGDKVWLLHNNQVYEATVAVAHLEVFSETINEQYDLLAVGGYQHHRVWASKIFKSEFAIYEELSKDASRYKE